MPVQISLKMKKSGFSLKKSGSAQEVSKKSAIPAILKKSGSEPSMKDRKLKSKTQNGGDKIPEPSIKNKKGKMKSQGEDCQITGSEQDGLVMGSKTTAFSAANGKCPRPSECIQRREITNGTISTNSNSGQVVMQANSGNGRALVGNFVTRGDQGPVPHPGTQRTIPRGAPQIRGQIPTAVNRGPPNGGQSYPAPSRPVGVNGTSDLRYAPSKTEVSNNKTVDMRAIKQNSQLQSSAVTKGMEGNNHTVKRSQNGGYSSVVPPTGILKTGHAGRQISREYEDVTVKREMVQPSRGLVRNRTYDAAESDRIREQRFHADKENIYGINNNSQNSRNTNSTKSDMYQTVEYRGGQGTTRQVMNMPESTVVRPIKKPIPGQISYQQPLRNSVAAQIVHKQPIRSVSNLQISHGQPIRNTVATTHGAYHGHTLQQGSRLSHMPSQSASGTLPARGQYGHQDSNVYGAVERINHTGPANVPLPPPLYQIPGYRPANDKMQNYQSYQNGKENENPNRNLPVPESNRTVQRDGSCTSSGTSSPIYEQFDYSAPSGLQRNPTQSSHGINGQVQSVNGRESEKGSVPLYVSAQQLDGSSKSSLTSDLSLPFASSLQSSVTSINKMNSQDEIGSIISISTQNPDPTVMYCQPVYNNTQQRAPSALSDWSDYGLAEVFQENQTYSSTQVQPKRHMYDVPNRTRQPQMNYHSDEEGGFLNPSRNTQTSRSNPNSSKGVRRPTDLQIPNVISVEPALYEPVEYTGRCAGGANVQRMNTYDQRFQRRDVPPNTVPVSTINRHIQLQGAQENKAFQNTNLVPPVNKGGGGLRVTNPADLPKTEKRSAQTQNSSDVRNSQTSTSKGRVAPRRHTVGGAGIMDLNQNKCEDQRTDQQRDAFFEHLAYKYPEHADLIKGRNADLINARNGNVTLNRPSSALDNHSRRKTTTVSYSTDQSFANDDNDSVMSEINTSATGFRRGGRIRSSLPIVRDQSKSSEKPIGLVFLTFRGETKRALLPNEITSLDTVRALFVRSFPDHLTMVNLETQSKKIYMLDSTTNVYFELDNVNEIKDRTVLKIYEKDVPEKSPRKQRPDSRQMYTSGHESDSSTASSHQGAPRSPAHVRANFPPSPRSPSHANYANLPPSQKAQSLPVQSNAAYQEQMRQFNQYEQSRYTPHSQFPRDRTASPSPHGSPLHGSPHRLGPPAAPSSGMSVNGNQRHSVAYIPNTNVIPEGRIPQSRSYHDYQDNCNGSSRSGSSTPQQGDYETASRMVKMETQLANLTAWVQTAVMKTDSRPGSARSHSSIVSEGSLSARSKPNETSQNAKQAPPFCNSKQTAPLCQKAPHRLSAPSCMFRSTPVIHGASDQEEALSSGMSDVSSSTPQPLVSVDMQNSVKSLNFRIKELRTEWKQLRRMQQANSETMHETIQATLRKIQDALSRVPGADDEPIRVERTKINNRVKLYKTEHEKIMTDLGDLEISVEELRADVLNKHCRVNMTEVEAMALQLSQISKSLAEVKAKFPLVQDNMKMVMSGEMEIVVKEERFLKDEPERIDNALKRCKKLTGTLFTLKRLASVQEHRAPTQPSLATSQPQEEKRKNLLDNIQSVIPNHEARVQSLEAADASRERKKKLQTQQESLKFEKTLEMASRGLRGTQNVQENEQRMQDALKALHEQDNVQVIANVAAASDAFKAPATLPLTETTKRVVFGSEPGDARVKGEKEGSRSPVDKQGKASVPGQTDTVKRVPAGSDKVKKTVAQDRTDSKKTMIVSSQQEAKKTGAKQSPPKEEPDGKSRGPPKPPRISMSPKSSTQTYTHTFTETVAVKTSSAKPVSSSQEKVHAQGVTSIVTSTPVVSSLSKQQRASHVAPATSPIKPVTLKSPPGAAKKPPQSPMSNTAKSPPVVSMATPPLHSNTAQSSPSVSMGTKPTQSPTVVSMVTNTVTSPSPSRDAKPQGQGEINAMKEKGKKVPPPPPPRRSSRTHLTTALPLSPKPSDSEPPAYENIENLGIVPGKSAVSDNGPIPGYTKVHNTSSQSANSSPSAGHHIPHSGGYSMQSPPASKPLSRYQQDIMAGICANIIKPDLQEQRVNHESVLHSPHHKVDTKVKDGSSDSESASSVDSQQGVTMRKAGVVKSPTGQSPKIKSPTSAKSPLSQIPRSQNSQKPVQSRESLSKKVPPPPPVRKTSTLSSSQNSPVSPNVTGSVPNKDTRVVKNNQNGTSKNVANGGFGKNSSAGQSSGSVTDRKKIGRNSVSAKSPTEEKETDIF